MEKKLQFNQLQTQNTQLTLLYPEKKERFVNDIHDHRQELRSSNELLVKLHESGRNEEKSNQSHKETWAAPSTKKTSANPVILTPRESSFTKRNILTREKKWIVIHAHSRHGGDLTVSVSRWSQQCFDIMANRNDNVMVRDIGTLLNQD